MLTKTDTTSTGGILHHLRHVSLFSQLDDDALALLARKCRRRTFAARAHLVHENEKGETLYLLLSGSVSVEKCTPGGTVVHIAVCGPGECFGELSLLDGGPRSADVITREASDVLMLDRSAFVDCVHQSPALALAVITSLAARLRKSGDRMTAQVGLDALGRLARFLLEQMEAASAVPEPGGIRLSGPLTQREIAERIGASRETVNRLIGRLKKSGVLRENNGCLIVASRAKLKAYGERG